MQSKSFDFCKGNVADIAFISFPEHSSQRDFNVPQANYNSLAKQTSIISVSKYQVHMKRIYRNHRPSYYTSFSFMNTKGSPGTTLSLL